MLLKERAALQLAAENGRLSGLRRLGRRRHLLDELDVRASFAVTPADGPRDAWPDQWPPYVRAPDFGDLHDHDHHAIADDYAVVPRRRAVEAVDGVRTDVEDGDRGDDRADHEDWPERRVDAAVLVRVANVVGEHVVPAVSHAVGGVSPAWVKTDQPAGGLPDTSQQLQDGSVNDLQAVLDREEDGRESRQPPIRTCFADGLEILLEVLASDPVVPRPLVDLLVGVEQRPDDERREHEHVPAGVQQVRQPEGQQAAEAEDQSGAELELHIETPFEFGEAIASVCEQENLV